MTYQDFGRYVKKAASLPLHMLAAVGRGVAGMRLYETLQRMSDKDLAALGIDREGIILYVARRMDPQTLPQAGHGADVHPFAKPAGPQDSTAADERRAAA